MISRMQRLCRITVTHSIAWIAAIGFIFLLPHTMLAQQGQSTPVATFKSRAELVLVPTIVTGRNHEHVSGLTKEDFTVLENGKEQKIAVFEEVRTTQQAMRRVPGTRNEFNNYLEGGQRLNRLTIILLDLEGTWWYDLEYARHRLLKYLAGIADTGEPIALLVRNSTGVHVLHDFSTDPKILAAALKQSLGEQTPGAPADTAQLVPASVGLSPALLNQELARLQGLQHGWVVDDWAQQVQLRSDKQVMEEIAHAYAGIPGQKALVWVADYFPLPFRSPTDGFNEYFLEKWIKQYQRTLDALTEAQISIYPISAEGVSMAGINVDRSGNMRDLAAETGGKSFANRNDLETGFRQAAEDFQQYYMLGYYLDRSTAKRGWRKLSVKVRDADLKTRARNGFFVRPDTPESERTREAEVALALTSSLDFTGVPLKARLKNVKYDKVSHLDVVEFAMAVPPQGVTVDENDNNHVLLNFAMSAEPAKGKTVFSVSKKLEAHFKPESLQKLQKSGLTYSTQVELAPGKYTFRLVARDSLSGRIGSVVTNFTVE